MNFYRVENVFEETQRVFKKKDGSDGIFRSRQILMSDGLNLILAEIAGDILDQLNTRPLQQYCWYNFELRCTARSFETKEKKTAWSNEFRIFYWSPMMIPNFVNPQG